MLTFFPAFSAYAWALSLWRLSGPGQALSLLFVILPLTCSCLQSTLVLPALASTRHGLFPELFLSGGWCSKAHLAHLLALLRRLRPLHPCGSPMWQPRCCASPCSNPSYGQWTSPHPSPKAWCVALQWGCLCAPIPVGPGQALLTNAPQQCTSTALLTCMPSQPPHQHTPRSASQQHTPRSTPQQRTPRSVPSLPAIARQQPACRSSRPACLDVSAI